MKGVLGGSFINTMVSGMDKDGGGQVSYKERFQKLCGQPERYKCLHLSAFSPEIKN